MRVVNKGDDVAWTMNDGHTMAGTVTFVGYDTLHVTRVDGSACEIATHRVQPSTYEDVMEAIEFFKNIGKPC